MSPKKKKKKSSQSSYGLVPYFGMPQNMYHDFNHRNLILASTILTKSLCEVTKNILPQNKYTIKIVI